MRCFDCQTVDIGDVAYSNNFRVIRQTEKKTKIYPWHFGFHNYSIEKCAEKIFPEIEGHFGIKFSQKVIIICIRYKTIASQESTLKRVEFYKVCFKLRIKRGDEIKNLLKRFCSQYRYKLVHYNSVKGKNFVQKYFGKFLLEHGFELISCNFEIDDSN